MVIAIDFDGTCVTHEFPEVGQDIGAAPILKQLVKNGHQLILYTMRGDRPEPGETGDDTIKDVTGMFLTDAINWFKKNDIPLYGIQTNPTQKKWTDSPKCYAQLYIDDAGLGMPLKYNKNKPYVDWDTVELILIGMDLLGPF